MRFTFILEDADNCRTYFRGSDGVLYCMQSDGPAEPRSFYACTDAGEPSHRADWPRREQLIGY